MKRLISILLTLTLLFAGPFPAVASRPDSQTSSLTRQQLLDKSYLELFEQASQLRISAAVLSRYRKELEQEAEQEKKKLEAERNTLKAQLQSAQKQLEEFNRGTPGDPATERRRHAVHCLIQDIERKLADNRLTLEQGVKIAYENKLAKLSILEEWPAQYARLQTLTPAQRVTTRKFGDFRDIGFRKEPFNDQEDDIKAGQEALRELHRNGLLPPEVEDKSITEYVQNLGNRIAANSDLRIPLHIKVLKSKEINAFALPGGHLFVNTGLIEKAASESELAGVLAHEIAHIAARHSKRLSTRATIASIIFQAAQIAAMIFTGGVVGIGTYYALQYGFYGLGMLLSLELLGVSRDYEIEADILGTQYLWKTGYNTRGFINFFDKMANEKGYVTGLSWFRTHPPFYERMATSFEEIILLPPQENVVDDTSEFQEIRKRVAVITAEMDQKQKDAPSLKKVYECDDVSPPPGTSRPSPEKPVPHRCGP